MSDMESIERFEGEFAVIETDEGFLNVLRSALPADAKEGDILRKTEEGYEIDTEAANKRRASLAARRRRMLGGNGR